MATLTINGNAPNANQLAALRGPNFYDVTGASASLQLKPGNNIIIVTYDGAVTLNLTSPEDCTYEVVRGSGTGTVTINRG